MKTVTVRAHANIALVKYWGKRNPGLNIPATGSISMTLSDLHTTTTLWENDEGRDSMLLNGSSPPSGMMDRTVKYLDLLRDRTGVKAFFGIDTGNNFPTSSGLASSASGFAALAAAFFRINRLEVSPAKLGMFTRLGSGSAPRSLIGGFAEMKTGQRPDGEDSFAVELCPPDYWDLRLVVAANTSAQKKTGSTSGMEHTRETSPYWDAWIRTHASDLEKARNAIRRRDFKTLGTVAEANALAMHASAIAARPGIVYWNPVTIECMNAVLNLRNYGVQCYFTIDAGPHVKVLCLPDKAAEIAKVLGDIEGVQDVIINTPGPGIQYLPGDAER